MVNYAAFLRGLLSSCLVLIKVVLPVVENAVAITGDKSVGRNEVRGQFQTRQIPSSNSITPRALLMRSWELVNKFRLHENNLKNLHIAISKGASIFNVLKDEPFLLCWPRIIAILYKRLKVAVVRDKTLRRKTNMLKRPWRSRCLKWCLGLIDLLKIGKG